MKKVYVIIFFSMLNAATQAQWVITSGPSEPNIVTLSANDEVIMAGCSSVGSNQGGHRTLNEGNNWSATGFSLLSKFNSLAINPNTGTIYAGGLNCFYQSFDNGASFTNTNTGLSAYTTRDIHVEGNNLYASDYGIYLSTNGGFNWSLISPVINSNKMDKIGNTILVGTLTAGVYLSLDNGNNWTNPNTGLPTNITDVKIIGTNLLAANASGVFISTNNGLTWTITNLTSSTQCFYQIGSTLFAGCGGGGVYYSNDGGNTWIASNAGLSNMTVYSLTSNSNYLFAGTTGYVFRRPLTDFTIVTNCSNNTLITPLTNSLAIGNTATFNATTSDPNPSYIWQCDFGQGFQTLNNFANYSGVNTSTLNITNVQLANHNQPIRAISISGSCIDTSNIASIIITDTCIATVYDTILTQVFDTTFVTQTIYDTLNVTIYDTLLTTVTDTLVINATLVGLPPLSNVNTLKVYPNPANTHITIDFGNFITMTGYTVKIVNSTGQTVFTTSINQQTSYIDLSTWTGYGIYYVQLIDPQNSTIENRKIVIQ
jgi:hypothetical protein